MNHFCTEILINCEAPVILVTVNGRPYLEKKSSWLLLFLFFFRIYVVQTYLVILNKYPSISINIRGKYD